VEAICAGGIPIVEITMTVPNAVSVIRELVQHRSADVLIGAGTVTSADQAESCIRAGAQFLVSPPMAVSLVQMTGWTSMREDVDWSPVLKETPQFKPFLVWDKGRGLYAEPAIPVWDELETKLADRLVAAYADKSLMDNPSGISKAIKEMAAQSDDLLKKAGVYGTD
jgi:hypothetical protein